MAVFSLLKIDGIPGESPRGDGKKYKDYFELSENPRLDAESVVGSTLGSAEFTLEDVGEPLIALLSRCTEEADNEKDIILEKFTREAGSKNDKLLVKVSYKGANITDVIPYFYDGQGLNVSVHITFREVFIDGSGVKVNKKFSAKL